LQTKQDVLPYCLIDDELGCFRLPGLNKVAGKTRVRDGLHCILTWIPECCALERLHFTSQYQLATERPGRT
jgi:hypothetical protein